MPLKCTKHGVSPILIQKFFISNNEDIYANFKRHYYIQYTMAQKVFHFSDKRFGKFYPIALKRLIIDVFK